MATINDFAKLTRDEREEIKEQFNIVSFQNGPNQIFRRPTVYRGGAQKIRVGEVP